MQVGQYGKYNGNHYICVEDRGHLILIMDMCGNKRQISPKNFTFKPHNVARKVRYEGTDYLITKTQRIISLQTNRFMGWTDTHPIRQAILNLRGIDQAKQALKGAQYTLPL